MISTSGASLESSQPSPVRGRQAFRRSPPPVCGAVRPPRCRGAPRVPSGLTSLAAARLSAGRRARVVRPRARSARGRLAWSPGWAGARGGRSRRMVTPAARAAVARKGIEVPALDRARPAQVLAALGRVLGQDLALRDRDAVRGLVYAPCGRADALGAEVPGELGVLRGCHVGAHAEPPGPRRPRARMRVEYALSGSGRPGAGAQHPPPVPSIDDRRLGDAVPAHPQRQAASMSSVETPQTAGLPIPTATMARRGWSCPRARSGRPGPTDHPVQVVRRVDARPSRTRITALARPSRARRHRRPSKAIAPPAAPMGEALTPVASRRRRGGLVGWGSESSWLHLGPRSRPGRVKRPPARRRRPSSLRRCRRRSAPSTWALRLPLRVCSMWQGLPSLDGELHVLHMSRDPARAGGPSSP